MRLENLLLLAVTIISGTNVAFASDKFQLNASVLTYDTDIVENEED